jgi:hypothetical protein
MIFMPNTDTAGICLLTFRIATPRAAIEVEKESKTCLSL